MLGGGRSQVFYKKEVLESLHEIQRETPTREFLYQKVDNLNMELYIINFMFLVSSYTP